MLQKTEMYKKLYTTLEELGLKRTEIDLYITSLSSGPSTIHNLAKELNIPRPNLYKIIQSLEIRGLAKFSSKKKYARTFIVEPPNKILELLREKQKELDISDKNIVSLLPDLMAIYHQGETPTKIKVLQGEEQYKKAFDQVLEEAQTGGEFLGSTHDFINFLTWEKELAWQERRKKKNLHIKILTLPSETANELKRKDREQKRETRILQAKSPFSTSFQLFSNKVIIWQPKAPLALLIEDEYIVEMLRSLFYILWEKSK